MKWTVGMALYDDPNCPTETQRAAFTAMALLTYHPLVDEVLIVNNNPIGPAAASLSTLLEKTGRGRQIDMSRPVGTSAPRNRVFEEARNKYVACIDPHVLLTWGFFESLNEFYKQFGYDSRDLLHGPMLNEAGGVMATHMNDQWRSEMWGTWGRAWRHPAGFLFSTLTRDDKTLEYVSLDPSGEQTTINPSDYGLPELPWCGHEKKLWAMGCADPEVPFPVPGHGMGFFACRKEAWLPFHQDCRGFGGEEMTTGYRYRQAGRKCWCVPGAKWWHHFSRTQGAPYRLTVWDKCRNYFLEFKRLGLDPAVIRENFPGVPDYEWSQLLAGEAWPDSANAADAPDDLPGSPALRTIRSDGPDPDETVAGAVSEEKRPRRKINATEGKAIPVGGISGLFELLDRRFPDAGLKAAYEAASGCRRVVELWTRNAAYTAALVAAGPGEVITYDTSVRSDGRAAMLGKIKPEGTAYLPKLCKAWQFEPPNCDLLLLNEDDPDLLLAMVAAYADWPRKFLAVAGWHLGYESLIEAAGGGWDLLRSDGRLIVLKR